ncbi:ubiquitin-like protein [Hamiltosporidium tvaerminnensis]|uniref:Ubiquitin-like protein n=1 Tax=Hamiltosporidium tvaerminnensis TaxID=1176355 RepID=A0A4Q9L0S8_9MICR|nr:hypothetical protein LUQ84_001878 [Hamiltosporidium tvaerminnensis]TBU00636.1 ubiquitin-like protein [Hamiltosporidium tvaerminnensis]
MQITLKLNNKKITLEVDSIEMSILSVKKKLEEVLEEGSKIPAEQQKFVINGIFLDNKKTLKDYDITESSVIHVIGTRRTINVPSKKDSSIGQTNQSNISSNPPSHPNIPNIGNQPSYPSNPNIPSNDSFNDVISSQLDAFINNPSIMDQQFGSFMGNMNEEQKSAWKKVMTEQLKEIKKNPQLLRQMMSQFSGMGDPNYMAQQPYGAPYGAPMQSPYNIPQPIPQPPMQSPYNTSQPPMQSPYNIPQQYNTPTIPCSHGFYPLYFINYLSSINKKQPEITNYEEFFKEQLKLLEEMGYTNKQVNLEALKECNGDINDAIDWIIRWNSSKK